MAEIIPSGIILSEVSVDHNTPNYSTTSMSEIVKSRTKNLHFLTGTITLTAGEFAIGRRSIEGFLLRCRGRLNSFEIPLLYNCTGVEGQPYINGNHSIGATVINIGGLGGTLFLGDVIKFPNDDKLYYVMTEREGDGTMEIFPPLRVSQSANNSVLYTEINPIVLLSDDKQTTKYNENGIITETTLSWKETL